MALVDVGPLWMPEIEYQSAGAPTYVSTLLDAAADRYAVVWYAPKAGDIRKVGFLTGTVPALGGTTTIVFSLQNVDLTTGFPDDTDDQSVTIPNGSIVANTMIIGTLSADRTVTKGELLAVVVKYGTFNAGDQVNIRGLTHVTGASPTVTEYPVSNLTGAYAVAAGYPVFEIEYADGSHAYSPALAYPWSAIGTDSYNNTSTPDEVGLQFQMPVPCRLSGCWMSADLDGDITINLYSATTKTAVCVLDKDVRASLVHRSRIVSFAVPVVLAANTTYVLAVEPTSATSIILSNHSVRAAVALDQMAGGQAWQHATAKNPATTADFTMTTTKRPVMGLMFDQVDNGLAPRATYMVGV